MSKKDDENSNEQSLEINFKDSIIKHPEFIKVIKDEKRTKLLQDETHHKLVSYLRKGPMTIESLFEAYKRDGNEKSKKSIYRYLKTLKDAGLVEQVGTRTSESESGDIAVENLFGRKAKIFYFFFDEKSMEKDGDHSKKQKKKMDRIGSILEILLRPKYPNLTKEKIESILETIGNWQKVELEDLSTNDKISEELVNHLEELDWKEMKTHNVIKSEEFIEILGEGFYSETIKIPIIENLEVTKIITFIKDITHNKTIELQLKEKEIRYRTMFEESPIALREEDYTEVFHYLDELKESGVTDLRGFLSNEENFEELKKCASLVKVLDVNKADLKLFGTKSKEEIIGKLTKKFSPQAYLTFKEGILSIYEGEKAYNSEIVIKTNSGDERYANLNLILIPSDNHTIKALVSLVDITDNMEIEKKLIESFDEYHFVFENSPVALWLEDFSKFKEFIDELKRNGIKDFREYFENNPEMVKKCTEMATVEDVNKATIDMYNLHNKSEILGTLEQFLTEDSFETFKEEFIALAEGKTEFKNYNVKNIYDNKTQYFNIHLSVPDGYKDSFKKVLVSGVEITDLRNTENELLKQRTELSEFAHFMAHDLNNSINVITAFVELLKEDFKPEYLEKIRKKALNMSNILNKSLSLADAGLIINKTKNVDLNSLVRSIVDSLITKDIRYSQDDLPSVTGDKEKISQIFSNMLENAISHGKPSEITIKFTHQKDKHLISIKNNGSPIPREIINKIFIRGFSTKQSTGLGLSIIKKLVEAHGWEISVISDQNQTCFNISIPI